MKNNELSKEIALGVLYRELSTAEDLKAMLQETGTLVSVYENSVEMNEEDPEDIQLALAEMREANSTLRLVNKALQGVLSTILLNVEDLDRLTTDSEE